jgi:hypothetical protein
VTLQLALTDELLKITGPQAMLVQLVLVDLDRVEQVGALAVLGRQHLFAGHGQTPLASRRSASRNSSLDSPESGRSLNAVRISAGP